MPYNNSLIPWRLIPIDIPPAKHRWKKFLKKLYENGGNLQEPSGGSSQSTEGSPTPERILKKNIMPNGAENITVVVFNKGNAIPPPPKPVEKKEKREKERKVRRTSNEVVSPEPPVIPRPSHSSDNLPSSYQRSNLTERRERTSSHDRLSSHDRVSSHERSHRKERRSYEERGRSEATKRHPEPVNPPLRPWFRSHDMIEDYGRGHSRLSEELPHQYRSGYAANIRVSLDSNSPRKVYDDSYHGHTRHRRHSDDSKRKPYSRGHSHTPAQERLVKLEKQLKEERKYSIDYCDKEASGSETESKRRKTPPSIKLDKGENGQSSLELDEEALEGVYQVKADDVTLRRNGLRDDLYDTSPCSSYDRYIKYDSKFALSPSSDSKCSTDSIRSESKNKGFEHNLYKRKHCDVDEHSNDGSDLSKLKSLSNSLACRKRSPSPEMMEWSSVDPELINSEIEEIRRNGVVGQYGENRESYLPIHPANHSMNNHIFIVVDTNVMCTDIIRSLIKISSIAGIELVVYVPWQVLMELDALKCCKREVARQAQRACAFMSDRSNQSSGRLKSQPPNMHHSCIDDFKPETPDDFVLLAALQLKHKNQSVILLTNDKNLKAKSEAAGVRNFTDVGINKILSSKNNKSEKCELESPPLESVKTAECVMAYRLASAFKNLLVLCLNRLEEVLGKLWVLYVPCLPPWSLIDAIRTLRSTWDLLCPDTSNHYTQFQLFNSIQYFFKQTTYDHMNVEKVHSLFDECCSLATSLPSGFSHLAGNFISQAKEMLDEHLRNGEGTNLTAKLSDGEDLDDLSPEERKESVSNIIDQFDVFSQKLLSFCGYVYREKGIEWPTEEPLPGQNQSYSDDFIMKFIPFASKNLHNIISSLSRLNNVQIGRVDSSTEGVGIVHKCLADFNGDLYKYSTRDVAAFANNPQVRANMDRGIKELEKLADILNKIM